MRSIATMTVCSIFMLLALLHFYWVVVGTGNGGSAIPEVNGRPAFSPTRPATLVVALLLSFACWLIAVEGGLLQQPQVLPSWFFKTAAIVICAVFGLRAVGDFRLVGFSKKIRDSRFAYWDTRLFSPIALVLSLLTLFILIVA